MYRFITIFFLKGLFLIPLAGQTIPSELVKAIREGDSRGMSGYFHQSLEMTILEKDYVASKNQATRIMEKFFEKHKPTGFGISFEGTKEKSKYAIGLLKTRDETFRINIFFMNKENRRLIYYLSIEKESNYELTP